MPQPLPLQVEPWPPMLSAIAEKLGQASQGVCRCQAFWWLIAAKLGLASQGVCWCQGFWWLMSGILLNKGGFRVRSSNGQGLVGGKTSSYQFRHRSFAAAANKGHAVKHSDLLRNSLPPHRHDGVISHSRNQSKNTKKKHGRQTPGSLQHSLRLSSDTSTTHL